MLGLQQSAPHRPHNENTGASGSANDRFAEAITAFLEDPHADPVDCGVIRLLAQSPNSPVALALWKRLPEIAESGATLSAMFCIERIGGSRAYDQYVSVFGERAAQTHLRLATKPGLNRMFEQATLGGYALWIGGRMNEIQSAAGKIEIIRGSLEVGQRASVARLNFGICWRGSEAFEPIAAA